MVRIYLLQAVRSLKNQKTHFLVILLGLSVSMASAFLIYSYVFFERSYDSFHSSKENLYRVVVDAQTEGEDAYKSPFSFSAQGPTAFEEVPEVVSFTRLASLPSMVVSADIKNVNNEAFTVDDYYYADENFFENFSFPLIHGSVGEVLKNSGSVVISRTLAEKLFGNENPVGKNIKLDGKYLNMITGVMEDIPENSHLKFEMIFSMKNIPWFLSSKSEWTNHSFFTYFLLKDGTDSKVVEKKITKSFIKENRAVNQSDCVWHLQRVSDTYLDTGDFTSKPGAFKFGDQRMIYFLSLITILLLSVSWVNYINLLTAKNNERLGEVKVRKVNGANKKSLMIQFFTESTFLNLSALFIACIIVLSCMQPFARFMNFPINVINYSSFWTAPLLAVMASILIPGFYTAYSLSKKQLDKKETFVGLFSIRDVMVVLQFVFFVALVSSVIIINRQLNYINSMDLGFNKEQVLVINIPRITDKKLDSKKIEIFGSELNQFPEIVSVSATTTVPGKRFGNGNGGFKLQGKLNHDDMYFRVGRVLKNYPELMDIKFIAGQSFDNSDNKLVLNKAAVNEFGLNNASEIIDKRVRWMGNEFIVAGVTENFHQESLHIEPEPLIMYTKQIENNFNYILVRLSLRDIQNSLALIEDEFKAEFPANPFSFFFLDDYFDQQYQKDIRFRMLFSFFSVIALIIGYFGMYSLTTHTIIKRIKEIGIRKVNGAKVSEILGMLNKDFVKWVAIAFVIATPIAYYAMNKWLENFAYKTTLSWWIFALAGVLALGIALLTVSWQSWKAATRNPVEALRYE